MSFQEWIKSGWEGPDLVEETETIVSHTPIQVHIRLTEHGWKAEAVYKDGTTMLADLVSYLPHQLGRDQIEIVARSYILGLDWLGCTDGNLVIGSDGENFTATWQA